MSLQEMQNRITKVLFTYFIDYDSNTNEFKPTKMRSLEHINSALFMALPALQNVQKDATVLLQQDVYFKRIRANIDELKGLGLSDNEIKKELGL